MQKYSRCQSCGMPLKKDPEGGGTELGGAKSVQYCSYCYENGAFKQADWTLEQMQALGKEKMQEMGFPGFIAGSLSKGIAKLERWKKQ